MSNQPQDTETLFTKKMPLAIVIMVFAVVNIVVLGIMIGAHHGYPLPLFYAYNVPLIVYAVTHLVFTIIGKNKGKENQIMAFVFGIITLGLCAIMVIDRLTKIASMIDEIYDAVLLIPSWPIYVVDVIMRSASLAFIVLITVFSILSIVNSVNIIKENVPSKSATTSTAGVAAPVQPATTTPPPASAGARAQFCSSCGAALDANAVFCNKCGAKVQ
ncbi:MAG: zinc ribbon domain-containing protein [Candidatus Sigynarchaeota archaeon]